MRRKTILIVILLADLFLSNALTAPARSCLDPKAAPSKLYSAFSFPDLLEKHRVLWKALCSSGSASGPEMGTMMEPSGTGSYQDPYRKSGGRVCSVGKSVDEKFKEKQRDFLKGIKSDLEDLIIKNGAEVFKSGVSSTGFLFEYSEGELRGTIRAKAELNHDESTGDYLYSVTVSLSEKREPEPKIIPAGFSHAVSHSGV